MDPLHHIFLLFKLQSFDSKGAMKATNCMITSRVSSHLEFVVRTWCSMCVYLSLKETAVWMSGKYRGDSTYLLLKRCFNSVILQTKCVPSVWSCRYLKGNFMPVALCHVSTRSIMIHLQMLIADWLTVLISKVIMINKTADEWDTNKGDFLTERKTVLMRHLRKWKSGLFHQNRLFRLLSSPYSNR